MTRTLAVAMLVASFVLTGMENAPAASTCRQTHVGAVRYCRAVAQRHAIRVVRRQARVEAKRAGVRLERPHRLGWHGLGRIEVWQRRHLRRLRAMPTYVVIRDMPSWLCIHRYEGSWTEVDVNGGVTYHGGLQMDGNFMAAYGRDMLAKYHGRGAEVWTPHEQLVVGQRGRDARGWSPWSTRGSCGL